MSFPSVITSSLDFFNSVYVCLSPLQYSNLQYLLSPSFNKYLFCLMLFSFFLFPTPLPKYLLHIYISSIFLFPFPFPLKSIFYFRTLASIFLSLPFTSQSVFYFLPAPPPSPSNIFYFFTVYCILCLSSSPSPLYPSARIFFFLTYTSIIIT